MASGNIYEAIAAIMCPMPDRDSTFGNPDLSEQDRDFIYFEAVETAERERARFLAALREAAELADERDADFDPLLDTIAECRAEMDRAEHRMRLLLAYGREFVRPQPYQLKDLAYAAGM